jgi:hypothetical protein
MISGYWSEMYAEALQGWSSINYEAMTRGGMASEWLWFNYERPVELHDYRFLGENTRKRQDFKRQIRSWGGKLARMDPLQRQALLAAIAGHGENAATFSLAALPTSPAIPAIRSPDLRRNALASNRASTEERPSSVVCNLGIPSVYPRRASPRRAYNARNSFVRAVGRIRPCHAAAACSGVGISRAPQRAHRRASRSKGRVAS